MPARVGAITRGDQRGMQGVRAPQIMGAHLICHVKYINIFMCNVKQPLIFCRMMPLFQLRPPRTTCASAVVTFTCRGSRLSNWRWKSQPGRGGSWYQCFSSDKFRTNVAGTLTKKNNASTTIVLQLICITSRACAIGVTAMQYAKLGGLRTSRAALLGPHFHCGMCSPTAHCSCGQRPIRARIKILAAQLSLAHCKKPDRFAFLSGHFAIHRPHYACLSSFQLLI